MVLRPGSENVPIIGSGRLCVSVRRIGSAAISETAHDFLGFFFRQLLEFDLFQHILFDAIDRVSITP
jgi:hypothetical protein